MQFREVIGFLLVIFISSEAFKTHAKHAALADDTGNPIRKVVAMMEKMAKKIEEEGKSEEDLFEKFECYCKKTTAELEESISIAVSSPMTQADIDSRKAEVDSLEAEVKKLKDDRSAEEDTLKAAEGQRNKEHQQYEEEHQEDEEVVASIAQASQALKGGGSALLQADKSRMLRAATRSNRLYGAQKQQILSLLSGETAKTDPDYVMGILNAMKDDTTEKITSDSKTEENAVENFGDLEASKKTEISTLLEQLERKMKRMGELKVEIVDMERSLAGQDQSLVEDRAMLAELKSSWDAKSGLHAQRTEQRRKELLALQDAINLLDSDKSLELFRGRASSTSSLLQTSKDRTDEVKKLLSKVSTSSPELNFLALALSGKQVDFTKIVEKIDGMIALLKTEQKDDEGKKAYCQKQFHATEMKSHSQQQDLASLAASISQKAEATKQLASEVKQLQDGIAAMDQSIATAGETRKAEHQEFQELMTSDTSAVQLLEMAKARLAKVYHPGAAALLSTSTNASVASVHLNAQLSKHGFVAPPATVEGEYQTQQSYGVLSMMDSLKSDIEQEIALAKMDEGSAQKKYEETLADAAKKREADLTLIAEKSKNKADLEMDLDEDKAASRGKKTEAAATADFVKNLHTECDSLLQNFDLRAEARSDEKENLVRAKTVLSGGA